MFQKHLRQQDAKTVEEKAAKIKEWVTNKLAQVSDAIINYLVMMVCFDVLFFACRK